MPADFIIVGAGTAGCVLAERLTTRGASVLILEAGGSDRHMHVQIPAAFPKLFKTMRDWAYETTPQPTLNERRIFWPRGKMLGGSSSMNAQIHQWCCASDFDQWRVGGAEGWGWDDMRPSLERIDKALNGGALRTPNQMTHAFLKAAAACGLPSVSTHNGGLLKAGAAIATVAHSDGARLNAAEAFLRPALRRNARVMTKTKVRRIIFEDRKAVGVEILRNGAVQALRAERGVILAAGAINSPQLLMHLGIGDGEALRRSNVKLLQHAPGVGANLQDHLMFVAHFAAKRPISLKSAESPVNLWRYLTSRRGMLASNVAEATAFFASAGADIDLELVFAPVLFENEGLSRPSAHGFSIGVVLLTPRSRGRVSLSRDGVTIDPAYLNADGDLSRLVTGVHLAQRIAQSAPLSDENARELSPASTSDADIAAAIRAHAHTIYHPVGTCRMGADDGAVVDPTLRVRGVDDLWVADASVIPTAPRGHPNAVVAAIADRAAAFIGA